MKEEKEEGEKKEEEEEEEEEESMRERGSERRYIHKQVNIIIECIYGQ